MEYQKNIWRHNKMWWGTTGPPKYPRWFFKRGKFNISVKIDRFQLKLTYVFYFCSLSCSVFVWCYASKYFLVLHWVLENSLHTLVGAGTSFSVPWRANKPTYVNFGTFSLKSSVFLAILDTKVEKMKLLMWSMSANNA